MEEIQERMAIHQINIHEDVYGMSPRVRFDPNPLVASTGDQVFWVNDDREAHWPGLLRSNGTVDRTFFIHHQIGPNEASDIFSLSMTATLNYACSLHPNERGVIKANGGAQDWP